MLYGTNTDYDRTLGSGSGSDGKQKGYRGWGCAPIVAVLSNSSEHQNTKKSFECASFKNERKTSSLLYPVTLLIFFCHC